ncbi:hypothetical protein DFJ73DRAFT_75760 [Zopfochytrium polystomum]|nr:hypothetical protein DFJ73DRAFT_75760 [Zopfochytrium polystomum]
MENFLHKVGESFKAEGDYKGCVPSACVCALLSRALDTSDLTFPRAYNNLATFGNLPIAPPTTTSGRENPRRHCWRGRRCWRRLPRLPGVAEAPQQGAQRGGCQGIPGSRRLQGGPQAVNALKIDDVSLFVLPFHFQLLLIRFLGQITFFFFRWLIQLHICNYTWTD